MTDVVPRVFAGKVQPMPGDGRPTGMFKHPVLAPVWVDVEGLSTDAQADRRVHGGPEKAVHQLPLENLQRLAQAFPEIAGQFVAGALGENLSTEGMTEDHVHIGDVVQWGGARLQVSQPRTPCWKIDARHGIQGIAAYVERNALAGWYFRVVSPGWIEPGDALRLVSRPADSISLSALATLWRQHRPSPEHLALAAAAPGLNADWRLRLQKRIAWLQANA